MRRTITVLAVASLLVGTALYAARSSDRQRTTQHDPQTGQSPQDTADVEPGKQPKIDIVIALDTSGSMSGLINAARQKLWDIVNEVAKAQPTPRLRVGLVTFGSRGSETDGYVVVRNDLTSDLDTIYSKLFELRTWGGTEYVGRAVYRSLNEISWDKDPDALRQIYVAGNESADQDRSVTAARALRLARERDVFVNAIYCGSESNYDAASWRRIASSGRGMYAAIDHNHGTVAIKSPFDAELARLSARLNGTYVGYGARGAAAAANQVAQDKNALRAHASAAATRALAKSTGVYNNSDWDLVDARKAGRKVKRDQLPAPLKKMSEAELRGFVAGKAKERREIRRKIRELSQKRRAFVRAEMKRTGKSAGKSFNTAVKRALRKQARKKRIKL